jgi:trigger factor
VIAHNETAKLEKSKTKLSITVAQSDVAAFYKDYMSSFVKDVQIPGFRRGKVPVPVLESKFGKEIKAEAFGKLMEDSIEEAFKDESVPKPLPYARTELEGEGPELALDKDLSFAVVYDVYPEFEVKGREGIEIEVPQVEIGAEDEERELKEIQERNAMVVDKAEGAAAAKDDVVTVNYAELDDEGKPLSGGSREDFVFTLGSGYNLYKFDDEVTGMKKGDTKAFTKEFPQDFEYPELAGKTKKLTVTLTQIKEKKLPALDDELAQDVSEKYKTLADLRADIRKGLEAGLESKLRELKVGKVVEAIAEKTSIDIPESMVLMELAGRWEDLKRRFGTNDDNQVIKFLSLSGKTQESVFEEWKPHAEKSLKGRLIIEKLIQADKIECADADVEAEIAKVAEGAGVTVQEARDRYEKGGMIEYLREEIKERKLFDALISGAKLKKGEKKKYVDMFKASE